MTSFHDDESPPAPDWPHFSEGLCGRPLTIYQGKGGGHTDPVIRWDRPESEFRQELDLYWKHARSFLVGGWKTGKHHTAACIRVYERQRDSGELWVMRGNLCTSNHGQRAGTGEMKFYAACRDMPITKGWVAFAGECGGKFPTHFCNDDTALQIRHAYGVYDDGSKCLRRKRTHRPWCERPW